MKGFLVWGRGGRAKAKKQNSSVGACEFIIKDLFVSSENFFWGISERSEPPNTRPLSVHSLWLEVLTVSLNHQSPCSEGEGTPMGDERPRKQKALGSGQARVKDQSHLCYLFAQGQWSNVCLQGLEAILAW